MRIRYISAVLQYMWKYSVIFYLPLWHFMMLNVSLVGLLVWSVPLVFLHLHNSPHCIMPFGVDRLLFKSMNFWLSSIFFKYLSHCEELINCASSWPEPGLFFSKCSFNKLFHSVLFQLVKTLPGSAGCAVVLWLALWTDKCQSSCSGFKPRPG